MKKAEKHKRELTKLMGRKFGQYKHMRKDNHDRYAKSIIDKFSEPKTNEKVSPRSTFDKKLI